MTHHARDTRRVNSLSTEPRSEVCTILDFPVRCNDFCKIDSHVTKTNCASFMITLHRDVCHGQIEAIKFLLMAVPKTAGLSDEDGKTPFQLAAERSQVIISNLLLEKAPVTAKRVF